MVMMMTARTAITTTAIMICSIQFPASASAIDRQRSKNCLGGKMT